MIDENRPDQPKQADHPDEGARTGSVPSTDPVEVPVFAAQSGPGPLWTRPIRIGVLGAAILAILLAIAFIPVTARNVTYNLFVDEGATVGIPRFTSERVMDVWRLMWDQAPTFGSVDLVRMTILIGATAFVLAGLAVVFLAFVPSRAEWVNDLTGHTGNEQAGD